MFGHGTTEHNNRTLWEMDDDGCRSPGKWEGYFLIFAMNHITSYIFALATSV